MINKSKYPICQRGTAAVEFALILPVMIILFFGVIEITRFAIFTQRLDKTTSSVADVVTRFSGLSVSTLNELTSAAKEMMYPFNMTTSGGMKITAIQHLTNEQYTAAPSPCTNATGLCIAWQYTSPGLNHNFNSRIGTPGSSPNVENGGYNLPVGQLMIVVEVEQHFDPLVPYTGQLFSAMAPQYYYRSSTFIPRGGDLSTVAGLGGKKPIVVLF